MGAMTGTKQSTGMSVGLVEDIQGIRGELMLFIDGLESIPEYGLIWSVPEWCAWCSSAAARTESGLRGVVCFQREEKVASDDRGLCAGTCARATARPLSCISRSWRWYCEPCVYGVRKASAESKTRRRGSGAMSCLYVRTLALALS
eukprot:6191505-Pleurochrysis_carterae.AAC.1